MPTNFLFIHCYQLNFNRRSYLKPYDFSGDCFTALAQMFLFTKLGFNECLKQTRSIIKAVRDYGTLFHVIKILRKLVVVFLCLVKLCQLNKPERHGYKVGNLNPVKMLTLMSTKTSEMEKSWINKSCYGKLKQIVDELVNYAVKYTYLREKNDNMQCHHYVQEEPEYEKSLFELLRLSSMKEYILQREITRVKQITELLQRADYFHPINIEEFLPTKKSHRHCFSQHLKKAGLAIPNVTLLGQKQ